MAGQNRAAVFHAGTALHSRFREIAKLAGDVGVSITKLSGEMVWMRWMGGVGITLMTTLLLRSLLVR